MASSLDTPMSLPINRRHQLPHIPNELRIRILSYVTDPRFLWNVCRWVSPEFKQWAEDQYAREHLPNLKLAIDLVPQVPKQREMNNTLGGVRKMVHAKSEFLFDFDSLKENDVSIAILPGNDVPWCEYRAVYGGHREYIRSEDDFDALAEPDYTCSSQIMTEIVMGLRLTGGEHYVCPCRSLRDQTKRGFCKRYIGAEKFFEWNKQDRVLELKWKLFMAFVYSHPCPAVTSSSQRLAG